MRTAREWYVDGRVRLIERNYVEMKAPHQRTWLDAPEGEHNNVLASKHWALETRDVALGRCIAAAASMAFWWLHGHVRGVVRGMEIFLNNNDAQRFLISLRIIHGAEGPLTDHRPLESGSWFCELGRPGASGGPR